VPEIICPLHAAAERHPDAPALIAPDLVYSYAQLDRSASVWSEYLAAQKVVFGARVAIIESNRVDSLPLLWALFRLGATAVLIDPRNPPDTVAAMLKRSGASQRAVFADSPHIRGLAFSELALPSMMTGPGAATANAAIDLDQPATIMFTSGSSGVPKAVLHSVGNHYYNALGSNENIAVGPQDRWLLSLPLFHVGGLAILFRCALAGAAVVLADPGDNLAALAVEYGVSHLSLVPTQLQRVLHHEAALPILRSQLKAILLGGAPASSTLITRAVDAGLPVFTSYGSTEMASQVATGQPGDPLRPKLLAHRELSLADDGEILVRGATLFKGYLTAKGIDQSLDSYGWFHTGDVGRIEPDGSLTVLGRKDNMFISGGENVHPEALERALEQIDGILQAMVVPADDPEFGRRPVAFVLYDYDWMLEDAEEYPVSEDTIRLELEKALPRFMLPVAIYPWPESYRSVGLKADRAFFSELVVRLRRH
jgi:O-succinylbenzoic acid--CoA ligase